jgi:cytochrome c peroxidase
MAASTALGSVSDVESFVREYFGAWQGTDEERIMSYYAENVMLRLPGTLMEGKAAVREQFVRPFITGFLMRRATWRKPACTAALLVILTMTAADAHAQSAGDPHNTGMADPAALMNAFDRFLMGGGAGPLMIPLVSLRGITSEGLNAGGRITVDLSTGAVVSQVRLMPSGASFELWFIDNRPGQGHTTLSDPQDAQLKVGAYTEQPQPGTYRLEVTLGAAAFAGFFPDRAFVVRAGQNPSASFVLTGSSKTFDRLARRQVRFVDDPGAALGFDPRDLATRAANFAKLVAQGRQLFLKETFAGNARTCGTCHVESNNFTIDPEFIATLPANDPLFVAEFNPALAALERPDKLRSLGLILVNADGFDPQRGFTLRATQNVQALGNSTIPQDPSFGIDFSTNGRNPNPPERLGWGNDAPPLRDFAIGAVIQHAPKALSRIRGTDFRVPTDEELDALVAYQLPLGRQEDFNLPTLELKGTLAVTGKRLYLDSGNLLEPGHKNCNGCHFNGGGSAGMSFNSSTPGFPRIDGSPRGFNIAAATNANETPLALALGLPRDGGFGQLLTVFGSFGNTEDLPPPFGHLELEEFNSPPVVESADTGPFFHNHTVKDLESAVAFYGTPAFQSGLVNFVVPVQISPNPDDPEVLAIAAFLRVLNALENIRSSINVAERGRRIASDSDARELATLALAEIVDAIEVLRAGALANSSEPSVLSARAHLLAARALLAAVPGIAARTAIDNTLEQAAASLRAARAALANPATLPPSFQN